MMDRGGAGRNPATRSRTDPGYGACGGPPAVKAARDWIALR